MGHDQRKGIANARVCMQHTGESAWRFKGGGHAVAGALSRGAAAAHSSRAKP